MSGWKLPPPSLSHLHTARSHSPTFSTLTPRASKAPYCPCARHWLSIEARPLRPRRRRTPGADAAPAATELAHPTPG
eukprot:scaffold1196_cov65-Isochrysis_galbana.AAC.1